MEKITLQKLVNHKNKYVVIPLLAGIFMALYTACGAFSHQQAVRLPMLKFEQSIPFWTETIWIYIIVYPLYLIWALYSYKDEQEMNKTLFGFIVLTLISCVCFILFPVTYPREMFPLPFDNNMTTLIFRATRELDKPNNCLPSLHVGLCFLFAFGFYRENKKKFWLSIFISCLIALSTLTTKQHYIYDIFLGFIISLSIFLFNDRKLTFR